MKFVAEPTTKRAEDSAVTKPMGRCLTCGEVVEIDADAPQDHYRYEDTTDMDHESKCYANGACSCNGVPVQGPPRPVPCGPVEAITDGHPASE